jgi:LacI family transcriptional regulator
VKKTRIFSHELSLENSRKTFKRLFSRQPWPDAVFCANDSTAITVLQEARAMGISVPGELRIVGYSNDPRSCIISPSITSVEQFPTEVGTRAASTIVELIRRKSPVRKPAEIVIPVELIERQSS